MAVVTSPLWFIPGCWYAAWRYRRMEEQSDHARLGRQVRTLGGELSRARIVHDAMFPAEFDAGHISFEYEYQPIQEIGGDYVHLHLCRESGRISLTLLDVAGHGLAAALTVNRLFGELERIRAENPSAEPGEVMNLLNRYINLTMAPHSMYATGTCIMLDPGTGRLAWVNAGHPPALVRRLSGEVQELCCTCMLLGAERSDDFVHGQQDMKLSPGDVVIAYTDGVIEAMDAHGRQFGMSRLRETAKFTPPPRNWPRFIASAVAKHRHGPPDDDLLVVQLAMRGLSLSGPAAWDTIKTIESAGRPRR
jgi:serine phosphatase RsbU (regulator of sigma subunit)